jgi:hypothetical protein
MHIQKIGLFIIFISLQACSHKLYLTPAVKAQLVTYNQPLEQVQLYIDRNINFTNTTETIDSLGNKKFSKRIIKLRRNTPGICVFQKDTLMVVQFESGEANKFYFGINAQSKPFDHYRILALKWTNQAGIINYEEKPYQFSIINSLASLKLPASLLKKLEKREIKKRTINGLSVPNKAISR